MKKQQMKKTAVAFAVTVALGVGVTVPASYAEPLTGVSDSQLAGSYSGGNLNVQALRNYSASDPVALAEENLLQPMILTLPIRLCHRRPINIFLYEAMFVAE